ncbi:MAG: hypothetical protein LCH95_13755 [Proteobacteria bacterium]|nr:hypothetical protein [Pseudomonadota bacterium]
MLSALLLATSVQAQVQTEAQRDDRTDALQALQDSDAPESGAPLQGAGPLQNAGPLAAAAPLQAAPSAGPGRLAIEAPAPGLAVPTVPVALTAAQVAAVEAADPSALEQALAQLVGAMTPAGEATTPFQGASAPATSNPTIVSFPTPTSSPMPVPTPSPPVVYDSTNKASNS